MPVNLSAVFRVQDRGSAQLRKIMQQTDKLNKSTQQATRASDNYRDAQGRLRNALGHFVAESNRASNANRRFSSSLSGVGSSVGSAKSTLSGLQTTILGIASAYITAQGAKSLFDKTIGQAMDYEQSEAIIRATFQDDGATKKYMDMVDKIAIDSPLLNSGDMFAGSKGLLTLSTDTKQLETAWGIVERLIASDPTKSIDDAIRGMRELSSGDTISLREVFNLDKNILNDVKKLSFEDQLKGIDKALTKMNITQNTVEAMGKTSKGLWTQITERADKFFREVGGEGNSVLGKQFTKALEALDKVDLSELANNIGSKLASGIQLAADAVTFVKNNLDGFKAVLNTVKEAVIALTVAFVAHKALVGAMAIYKTVATFIAVYRTSLSLATAAQAAFNGTMFANPIGLVIAAIAALIGITVFLVRNWETVTATVKRTWKAIGGGSGAIALILGPLGFLINAGVDLAKNWDNTRSVWENVWSAIQRSAATSVNAVIGLINSMIETINKIPGVNIPIVAKVNWGSAPTAGSDVVFNNRSTGPVRGYYHGLDNVAYDRMPAYLHKGEAVLNRQDATAWREGKSGGNVTIAKLADQIIVREDADIDRIAMAIAKQIESERNQRRLT